MKSISWGFSFFLSNHDSNISIIYNKAFINVAVCASLAVRACFSANCLQKYLWIFLVVCVALVLRPNLVS